MVVFKLDNIDTFIYENIEFFFSTTDLNKMMKIHKSSYEDWSTIVVLLKETDAKNHKDESKVNPDFNYNIMTDETYIGINSILVSMREDIINNNKQLLTDKINKIVSLYDDLYYYQEVYVHAHFVFNKIRKLIKEEIIGGTTGTTGISLEDFKEIIRQKIKLIMDQ